MYWSSAAVYHSLQKLPVVHIGKICKVKLDYYTK